MNPSFALYDALKQAGIEDKVAREAAESVLTIQDRESLATKADLHELRLATAAELAELKADLRSDFNRLLLTLIGLFIGNTALFAAIVKLF